MAAATGAAFAGTAHAEGNQVGAITADELAAGTQSPVVEELPFPGDVPAPKTTSYECDVLVIGAGWAGLHAAVAAARAGKSVVVVDKGRPGYSGMAPFSQGCTYYDPDYDDLEANVRALQVTGEWVANIDAFRHAMEVSKRAYDLNYEFGLTGGYLYAPADGYFDFDDDKAYFQSHLADERHHKWMQVLEAEGCTVVPHCMVTNLLVTDEGRVCGAVGLAFKSGTAITFNAKAVAMCAGSGTYKASGFVLGGDTFDGICMAYDLGLTIVGMETEDFHETSSVAAGDYHFGNTWDFVEPYTPYDTYATTPADDEGLASYASGKLSYMSANRARQALNGLAANDGTGVSQRTTNGSANPDDPRCAYCLSWGDQGKNRTLDAYGAAPGMPLHMASGVFCGWDVHDGATPAPGLFVAGDGEFGDLAEGMIYPFVGSTSTNCSSQGDCAGEAAAAFADTVELAPLPAEKVQAAVDALFAPRQLAKGFDPNYVVDRLVAIMSAPEVMLAKDAAGLQAALTQVEYLRDRCLPKLMGYTGHDLRIVVEARHKVLSAEMKLRASLAREESRGIHYRSDFPFRDDANFLCHIGVSRAEDGSMAVGKIAIPES